MVHERPRQEDRAGTRGRRPVKACKRDDASARGAGHTPQPTFGNAHVAGRAPQRPPARAHTRLRTTDDMDDYCSCDVRAPKSANQGLTWVAVGFKFYCWCAGRSRQGPWRGIPGRAPAGMARHAVWVVAMVPPRARAVPVVLAQRVGENWGSG